MMEAQELRIGNIIEGYLEPQVSEWVEIEVTLEVLGRMQTYPNTHGYRPVSLTGEWLVKLGFKQMYFLGAKIRYFIKGNLMYSTIDRHVEYKNGSINFIIRECEHVHDLQNLYQAMTGEELTLKPNP